MASSFPYVSPETFTSEVLAAKGLVLVDFCASWCGPCKEMMPALVEVARAYNGRVKVVSLDVDEAGALVERYSVRSVPTLLFFQQGRPVYRLTGYQVAEEISRRIDNLLVASA
ncbi:MAG: thioredoxin [Clostridia bacterium]|nr:MAG: thioredoxin [Clostridia bacterium]